MIEPDEDECSDERSNRNKAKSVSDSAHTIKRKIIVPIFDAEVMLVLTNDITGERRKMEHIFGPAPDDHDYDALTSYSGGHRFGLFINRKTISTKIIAHEVFHLTHRILDWVGANFDDKHHEQGALLCGYLMDWVCRKSKLKNKRKEKPD
jgi:hypothetical protein